MFVLETRAHAEARGATPLAIIRGYGRRHEPTADKHTPATGQSIRQAINATLAMASATPAGVGFVSAHGMSTEVDDRNEAQAIRAALGDVPVAALKSYFGNIGAAGGAIELAVAMLALERGLVPPTLNYETPDPACPVNVITELTPLAKPTVLAISHRTTGQAVAMLVEAL